VDPVEEDLLDLALSIVVDDSSHLVVREHEHD